MGSLLSSPCCSPLSPHQTLASCSWKGNPTGTDELPPPSSWALQNPCFVEGGPRKEIPRDSSVAKPGWGQPGSTAVVRGWDWGLHGASSSLSTAEHGEESLRPRGGREKIAPPRRSRLQGLVLKWKMFLFTEKLSFTPLSQR